MYALLTKQPNQTFDLPVTRTSNNLSGVIVRTDGKTYNLRNSNQETRAQLGWFDLIESRVDQVYYVEGSPNDTFDGTIVTRTYPDVTPKAQGLLKERKYAELADYRETVLAEAVESSGIHFRTTLDNLATLSILSRASGIPGSTNTQLKALNGWFSLTRVQMDSFYNDVSEHVANVYANERSHSDAISVLTDPQAIIGYDFTTGWPPTITV